MPRIDLTGVKQDKLLVLYWLEFNKERGRTMWMCKCDCGKEISVSAHEIKRGQKSCKECSKAQPIHFLSHTPEYAAWKNMQKRCRNPKDASYFRYGERGIDYDERWSKFENFYEDMGKRPDKSYTLERIDNNKGYSPENCKWATRTEQARNFRFNHNLEFNGQTKCISEWGEIYGLKHDTIAGRLELGWSIEKALTTKVKQNRLIEYNGKKYPIATVEKMLGMGSGTITSRLKYGHSEYDAVNMPIKNRRPQKTA